MESENNVAAIPSTASESVSTANVTDPAMWSLVEGHRQQRKSGDRWFYWIGGLSLVNAIIVAANGQWSFLAGLGVTQIISGLALGLSENLGAGVMLIAFALNLFVVGICIGFGYFAERGHTWAFIVGMILYALDALIFLWVQDWFPLGFHALALYFIYRGLSSNLQLAKLKAEGVAVA